LTEPEIKKASIVAGTVFIVCALICSIISVFYPFTDTTDIVQKAIIGFGFGFYIGILQLWQLSTLYMPRILPEKKETPETRKNLNPM